MAFNIFFIRVGKMAKSRPSIKKSKPNAAAKSFIGKLNYGVFIFPVLPKNLKNSLSGESTKDVSPPIKAVS